jgi:hypothetical protein
MNMISDYVSISTASGFCRLSNLLIFYCEFVNSKQTKKNVIDEMNSHSMVLVFEPFQKRLIIFESMAFMKSLYEGKSSAALRKTLRPSGMRKFISAIGNKIPQTKLWTIEVRHGTQKRGTKVCKQQCEAFIFDYK